MLTSLDRHETLIPPVDPFASAPSNIRAGSLDNPSQSSLHFSAFDKKLCAETSCRVYPERWIAFSRASKNAVVWQKLSLDVTILRLVCACIRYVSADTYILSSSPPLCMKTSALNYPVILLSYLGTTDLDVYIIPQDEGFQFNLFDAAMLVDNC